MKRVKVLKNITSANDAIAVQNKELFDSHNIIAINLMSSPGAGKTSLVLSTVERLRHKLRIAVIEGDIASRIDADRISKEGIPVVQINTGGSCSLEAHMVANALDRLPLKTIDLLFIENVGNLICPAGFSLGEHKKVVVSSIAEGDDKPAKYPVMFSLADTVVINKIDLLPLQEFDLAGFRKKVTGLNPGIAIFEVSCKTGQGIDAWCSWLLQQFTKPPKNIKGS